MEIDPAIKFFKRTLCSLCQTNKDDHHMFVGAHFYAQSQTNNNDDGSGGGDNHRCRIWGDYGKNPSILLQSKLKSKHPANSSNIMLQGWKKKKAIHTTHFVRGKSTKTTTK